MAAAEKTRFAQFTKATASQSCCWLSGINVDAPLTASAIVALGDSITDGAGSTVDADRRTAVGVRSTCLRNVFPQSLATGSNAETPRAVGSAVSRCATARSDSP